LENMRKQIPEGGNNISVSKIIEHIGTNPLNVDLLAEIFLTFHFFSEICCGKKCLVQCAQAYR